MNLRPYQREASDRVRDELARCGRALVVMATGLGKALRNDQRVLTPGGWKPIARIVPGDMAIGVDGYPTEVIGVYPQGLREMFEVEFTDGAIVVCDADHLWNVRTKYDRNRSAEWRTMTLREIQASGIRDNQNGARWEVPSVSPVEHPATGFPFASHSGLPLDPYLLGVLIGDGGISTKGRVLLTVEPELAKTIHPYIPSPARMSWLAPAGKASTYIIGGPTGRAENPVISALRALGLEGHTAHSKFVPESYIFAPSGVRLAVLQGLMDTDGYVSKDGHVEITIVSQRLACDIQAIVRSLGGRATVREKKTSWTYKGEQKTGIAWRVSIAMMVCPFRWKAPRWKPRTKYDASRRIIDVRPVGMADATCIKVAAEDGLFVTEGYIVTHNTVLFVSVGREMRAEGARKVLLLAHRDELLAQARDKWLASEPDAIVGIYQGDRRESWADVICASVQSCYGDVLDEDGTTVKRRGRIHDLLLAEIDLIIVDECHRMVSPSYEAVLKAALAANPDVGILAVTATPARADGKGLGAWFDRVAFRMGIKEGIEGGWLSPLRGVRVELQVDLSEVKIARNGDYDDNDLGRVLDTESAREFIVAEWLRKVGPGTEDGGPHGRFTASFSPTVASAEHLASEFERVGVSAGFVTGATKKKERKAILDAYQRGELRVLCNVGVLTEGWDAPHTSCILMARPTKSGVLYRQAVGRGTRLANGKDDCIVLDCVGANALGLQTVLDLSTPGADRVPGIDPEPEDELTIGDDEQTDMGFDEVETRRVVGVTSYEIDMLGGGVHWVRCMSARVATVDVGKSMIVFPAGSGTWSAMMFTGREVDVVAERVPEREALRAAEAVCAEIGVQRMLVPSDYRARMPATEKQIRMLDVLKERNVAHSNIDLSSMPPGAKMGAHQIGAWISYLHARMVMASQARRSESRTTA